MKVPLNWLKDYVDIDISQEELVAHLTAIGHMQDKRPESVSGDTVLDLEVRQNRSDCLSILGIAKEVAAVTGKKVKKPVIKEIQKNQDEKELKILNESPDNCFRFSAYKIAGLKADAQTPEWMKKKLEAYGMKTISPVVDITNFVMIETGEPMHAFDCNSVPNGIIKIRQAKKGEQLIVLGDKKITLTEDDLIVVDKNDTPISFSGLIGGATSGIKENSTEIIIEAATYNQAVIRRSSIRHSIRTEASTRHEKFLHTELVGPALDRAANLILEICGGKVVAYHENYAKKSDTLTITLPLTEIKRLGGVEINGATAKKYLSDLDFAIKSEGSDALEVAVPFERTDILESADLVEEVLRIYGYENIESNLPEFAPPKNITSKYFLLEEDVRDHMLSLGFTEIITEPLTSERQVNKDVAIPLQNALNAGKSYLRTSLLGGLSYAYKHAVKHQKEKVNLFELGKIYKKNNNKYEEIRTLGILIHKNDKSVDKLSRKIAGIVKDILENVLHKKITDDCKISVVDEDTVFCEIEINSLPNKKNESNDFFETIPHFTSIDISLSVHEKVNPVEIAKSIISLRNDLYDISYEENTKLAPQGQKYLLLKLVLEDIKETKDEVLKNISAHLTEKFAATIR